MGTVSVITTRQGRSLQLVKQGEETLWRVQYLVRWTPSSGADPFPGWAAIVADSSFPKPRERPPSSVHESDPFLKQLVSRSVRVVLKDEAAYTMTVDVDYSTKLPLDYTKPWVRVTRSMSTRTTPMFRRDPSSWPTDGDAAWPPSTDIGGDKMDINGSPRPYNVPQQVITLEHQWDRTLVVSGSPQGEPPSSLIATYAETRNSVAMFGWGVGQLLYKGFSIAPDDELYILHHTWIADPWYHLEQYPVPNAAGQPILGSVGSFGGVTVKQCSNVVWMQRYSTKTDHTAMFDPTSWSQISAELTAPKPAAL